ncbi:precorrin-6A reductase [Alteribacillus iranensis]|uniref:Cobalt-precorrin 6A reductase n=1 Tax=Alteribacillus iranensis TaxID=930128 RepID=A0A1I2B5Z8_9BACI|nr:precorrin-6A reductase [Alteribacillus iranensis]SFE51506.1 cobalt-precorrin 6A reductase [Alteribacillus iranensis]
MIFMLAGTSDAKELAKRVKEEGHEVLASVVTEEAAKKLTDSGVTARVGRLSSQDMITVLKEIGAQAFVDASHPFAEEASRHAITAAEEAGIPYIRYERESITHYDEKLMKVHSYEEAAKAAAQKGGTVFLTTGSKTLQTFAEILLPCDHVRMICRMLPRIENMEKCKALGVEQQNIVAMQGPFTKELNLALYKQFDVDMVVTKESGKQGSFDEKVTAALELGLEVILIKRPNISYGMKTADAEEVVKQLEALLEEEV